jgi:addiction module HigA family antidote
MTLLTMTPFKAHCDRADVGPSHPGEILREDLLPYYRLSVADLAQKLDMTSEQAADLVAERTGIDTALAARLGKVFALCPRYWLALQLQYDLWHKTSAVDDDANILPPSWGAYAGAAATP